MNGSGPDTGLVKQSLILHAALTCCALTLNASLLATSFFCPLHVEVIETTAHVFHSFLFLSFLLSFCLSLFLLLFVSHFSFVFCLICLPSANAFHPRVCGLQPLQPSGLQQPPAGRELRRLQQGNEWKKDFKTGLGNLGGGGWWNMI